MVLDYIGLFDGHASEDAALYAGAECHKILKAEVEACGGPESAFATQDDVEAFFKARRNDARCHG